MKAPQDASPPSSTGTSAASGPAADLSRLRIQRGADEVARVRGFPWIRAFVALGVLALLFLLREPLLELVGGAGAPTVRTARAVKVFPGQAQPGDVAANGYIVADTQASLATVLSGRLVELNAAEGDIVEAGSVVARIQYDDLEVQLRQAEAGRGAAEARLDEARTRTRSAQARVKEAESELAAARLTSTRLEAERTAQQKVVDQAPETSRRLQREVERNRPLFEKKWIDGGTWDRIQTEARVGAQALEAARARLRATEAAVQAWAGQIDRRAASLQVAEAAVAAAETGESVAKAAVAEAREVETLAGIMLEKTRIRAPFRGLVIRKDAEKGEVISSIGAGNSRGSVLTIVDPESLEVQVELSERRIAKVKEGDRAVVFLDAAPEDGLPGVVRKIWPRADRTKGTIELRIRLDRRPPGLRPEMAARVAFKGAEREQAADESPYVTVPRAAVVRRTGAYVVFVVEGGTVRRQTVSLGQARQGRVTVDEGLEGGEIVVLRPAASLEDGATVRTEDQE